MTDCCSIRLGVAGPARRAGPTEHIAEKGRIGWHALSLRRAWAADSTPFEDSGRATQDFDPFPMRGGTNNQLFLLAVRTKRQRRQAFAIVQRRLRIVRERIADESRLRHGLAPGHDLVA